MIETIVEQVWWKKGIMCNCGFHIGAGGIGFRGLFTRLMEVIWVGMGGRMIPFI